jgi:threonine/homoserine/homoserine lactone efflux protein
MMALALLGATYGFAAAVQPGQFQAYLISETLTNGWRRTVPLACAPLLSDMPAVVLVLLVLTRVPPLFVHGLQFVGGLFVLYLAASALRTNRQPERTTEPAPAPVHLSVLKAAMVNILNPNPYISWALILGPLVLGAWRTAPSHAIAFMTLFYLSMILTAAAIVMAFGATRALGTKVSHVLMYVSAVALAGFGLYQVWAGGSALLAVLSPGA